MRLKSEKIKWVDEKTTQLKEAEVFIFANYKGLTVADVSNLRRNLHSLNVKFEVVKNRLFHRAIGDDWKFVSDFVTGPTAVVCSKEEILTEVCKVLFTAAKDIETFEIKGGFLRPSRTLNVAEIEELAKIPGKDALISMFACALKAPLYNFHRVLSALLGKIVYVLSAVKEKKEKEAK